MRVALIPGIIAALSVLGFLAFGRGPSTAGAYIVGDADCNAVTNAVDALHDLRAVAGLGEAPCIAAGNVKCDDPLTATDALHILRYVAGLPVSLPGECPPIGSAVEPTASPTPASSPTPTATPPATTTPTPPPTPTPSPTPIPGDPYEPNESGISAPLVGEHSEDPNQQPLLFEANIHTLTDEDWFRVRLVEALNTFCLGDEDYRTTIDLSGIPAGRDYDLAVYLESLGNTPLVSNLAGNANEHIEFNWTGACGADDQRDLWIHVQRSSGDPSPANYTVTVVHELL